MGPLKRIFGSVEGRKGLAYTQALCAWLLLASAAVADEGLAQGELDALLMALAGILATFAGGNVGEHYTAARKATGGPDGGQ